MDNQWIKILVFTILALVLGFILGRVTGHHDGHPSKMMFKGHGGEMDHSVEKMVWMDEDGHKVVKIKKGNLEVDGDFEAGEGRAKVHAIIEGIEDSEFEGDSTFTVGRAKIQLSRKDGEMQVEVNIDGKEGDD
ncbi:MAG: hypothetical protein HQ500_04985 [Flavobacteriales bacterium]|nr:hypothetical protein [Flavobacteriales bacterium]